MKPVAFSFEQYLQSPLAGMPVCEFSDQHLLAAMALFFRWDSSFPHRKLSAGRSLCAAFAKAAGLGPFRLCVERKWQDLAYMRDGGDVYLSLGLLLKRSAGNVFITLCHEIAHKWLSEQENYSALKQMDRRFRSLFADRPHATLAAPIEMYAMGLSVRLARSVLPLVDDRKQHLIELIENEQEKIRVLELELRAWSNPDPPGRGRN